MSEFINGFGNAGLLAERAKKDENGNSLTLTIEEDKVTEIGGKPVGGGSSVSITETTVSSSIQDSNGDDILDSSNEAIGDSNSVTFVSGINGKSLLAERAKKDENGNSLTLTIEEDKVTEIGGKPVGGGSDLPTGGEAGQVLTKTENGYDWKYVTPLKWFNNKPDDATIEIDNNSYRNVTVDSCNNITFNVTTSSTHDFPNFVIDIHIDPGASIETLKINVTWTINATEHAGVETLHCPVTGNTLTVLPGECYQLCVVGQCWRIDKFIDPPSEGVEYVLLQNFISGHSIGTPDNGQWVTTVPNDWYDDLYQWDSNLSMFDDTTAGATLVDNRSPIDCSKYGISSGTPVATVTCDYGWHTDLAFSFDSGNISTPFTVETFFACREPYEFNHNFIFYIGAAKYRPEDPNELHLALKISRFLDSEDPNDTHIGLYLTDEYTDDHKLLGFEPDGINPDSAQGGPYFTTWIASWHHFAVTVDTSNLYVFVDGKLYATLALSTTITNENSVTKTLDEWIGLMPSKILITSFESGEGNGICGLWAQLAVCKACKWTTDFTVPTEAY